VHAEPERIEATRRASARRPTERGTGDGAAKAGGCLFPPRIGRVAGPKGEDLNLARAELERLVRAALDEDIGTEDLTSEAVVPSAARARGRFLAKQAVILAGLDVARTAVMLLDPQARWQTDLHDGDPTTPGQIVAVVTGLARPMLAAERVALNFLQRLTGVATLTRRFVDAVAGTRARIRDTRKTTPLLRALEKYAVEIGGGVPHRSGLDSGVLIKENHVRLAGSVGEATRRAMRRRLGYTLEVEVEHLSQIEEALTAGAGMILLDNFTPEDVMEAVRHVGGRVPVEVSGGVRLDNVRSYAEADPDFIAVGALTHSAAAVDISLEIEPEG
jgi:nicotinate-nucleotide pyrophosphorylase (carboxylating)